MQKYIDQVKQIKQKPEHVRHRIALGTSIGVTALVGVIWLVGSASSGKFALTNPYEAEPSVELADTKTQFTKLVGAAAEGLNGSSTQPQLNVVDGETTSTIGSPASAPVTPANATAIPF